MFAWLWGDRITALEFLYDITKAFAFDGMVQSLDLHELRSMPVDHCVRFPVSSMIVPIVQSSSISVSVLLLINTTTLSAVNLPNH